MLILKRLSEGLDGIKPYVMILFYPAALSIIFPGTLLELIKLIANVVASAPHECGHVIFNIMGFFLSFIDSNLANSPFYNFLTALAGSVGYTVPPFVLFVYYAIKEDGFAASAYLAFLSVSVDHMAWYCADALNQHGPIFDLGLLSGHHDWYYMLNYLGTMNRAMEISIFFYNLAYLMAMTAILSAVVELVTKITKKKENYPISLAFGVAGALLISAFRSI